MYLGRFLRLRVLVCRRAETNVDFFGFKGSPNLHRLMIRSRAEVSLPLSRLYLFLVHQVDPSLDLSTLESDLTLSLFQSQASLQGQLRDEAACSTEI